MAGGSAVRREWALGLVVVGVELVGAHHGAGEHGELALFARVSMLVAGVLGVGADRIAPSVPADRLGADSGVFLAVEVAHVVIDRRLDHFRADGLRRLPAERNLDDEAVVADGLAGEGEGGEDQEERHG